MPGKHQLWLQKTRVILTIAAVAVVLIIYGVRYFLGS
jgi:hypothetical protein